MTTRRGPEQERRFREERPRRAVNAAVSPYPTPPPHGRGHHRPLLPRGGTPTTLSTPMARKELRVAQEPLGLGGHITLALLQQLRGVESEHSFVRDAARFFAHLFPGIVGLHPSSFNRRLRGLRRFLEPLRRAVVGELLGDPETLIVDSTLLSVSHPGRSGNRPLGSRGRRGRGGAPSRSTA